MSCRSLLKNESKLWVVIKRQSQLTVLLERWRISWNLSEVLDTHTRTHTHTHTHSHAHTHTHTHTHTCRLSN